jgi:UDP-2,3-diacylglucosamine hydrolase
MEIGDKKIYFASDFHLGIPSFHDSLPREKKIVKWLNEIEPTAQELFLVGDLFDFWFEYKHVVQKGFTRLLGKLATMVDSGLKLHIFSGNHDVWMRDYLIKELGANVYHEPQIFEFNNKIFYIGHGDGLGPGDRGYKFIKRVFRNPTAQYLFRNFIHPDLGYRIASSSSKKSRSSTGYKDAIFKGEDKEWLIIYSKEVLSREPIDYFIYGHRHLPMLINISENPNSVYCNLGDWLGNSSYAQWNGKELSLLDYNK